MRVGVYVDSYVYGVKMGLCLLTLMVNWINIMINQSSTQVRMMSLFGLIQLVDSLTSFWTIYVLIGDADAGLAAYRSFAISISILLVFPYPLFRFLQSQRLRVICATIMVSQLLLSLLTVFLIDWREVKEVGDLLVFPVLFSMVLVVGFILYTHLKLHKVINSSVLAKEEPKMQRIRKLNGRLVVVAVFVSLFGLVSVSMESLQFIMLFQPSTMALIYSVADLLFGTNKTFGVLTTKIAPFKTSSKVN